MQWRERLATFAFLMMEGCWLAGVAIALGAAFGTSDAPLGIGGVLVGLAGAYYVNWWLQRLPLALILLRALSVLGAAAFLFVLLQAQYGSAAVPVDPRWVSQLVEQSSRSLAQVRGVLLGAVLLLGLWWRGARLAGDAGHGDSLLVSFKVGLAALAVVALGQAAFGVEVTTAGLVIPFFGFGLASMALGQLAAREEGLRDLPPGYWLAVTAATVGLLLVAGLLLGLLGGVESARAIGKVLGAIGGIVSRVLDVVILGIAWLVGWLYTAFQAFFLWLRALLGAPTQEESQPPPTLVPPEQAVRLLPEGVTEGLKWGMIGLLVLAVLLVLFFALLRRRREAAPPGPAFRESIEERGDLGSDLLAALGDLAGRFRRRRAPPAPQWGDSPREQVMRSYAVFLALASERGLARPPAVTPLEFLAQARRLFPQPEGQRLTDAFDRVRYGEWEPSPEEAATVSADLEALRLTSAGQPVGGA